jgi:uncharacterized repeat protein (TIGR04061 family)
MSLVSSASIKVIDRDLFEVLSLPAHHANYPRESRSFVRIDASLRIYWHTLFDICPRLLELSGPDGFAIYHPFMAWAAQKHLSLNWTYYLWVCTWLLESEFRDRVDEDLVLTLMGASAARWAVIDRSRSSGLAIGSGLIKSVVVGWKCRSISAGREVELFDLEDALPDPGSVFGFFEIANFEFDYFPGWQAIPR